MPKYRDYFRKMLDEHKDQFEAFAEIHAKYQLDQQKWQAEYNEIGKPIQDIIREWEQKLCGHSEKGKYAQFSSKLAEKFQEEVKAFFPLVDFIGVKVKGPALALDKASESVEKEPPQTPKADPDIQEIDSMDLDSFDIPKLF